MRIAGALDAQLSGTEIVRIAARDTRNLEAWENFVKANQAYWRFLPAEMDKAEKFAQRALQLD